MRLSFAVALVALAGAAGCAHVPPARMSAVDTVIAGVPAFAGLAAISRDGVTVHAAAYGLRDREAGLAHTPDETFRYASVSKMITAIMVFQEIDRGRMALDVPVATYLPTSGVDNADRITIRHLLAHRSRLAEQADLSVADKNGRIADPLEHCRKAAAEPGSGFQYNNCDTIILGMALEAVTGMEYLALVNARLAPIGVKLSIPAAPRVDAYMDATTREEPVSAPAFGPSGGLYGTAADLLAIDNAFMEGRLISKSSMDTMLAGDPASGFAALSVWSYEPDLKACLGKTRLVERYGEINGVQVRNFLLPDRRVAVVVYANDRRVDFGEIWRGEGFSIDLLRAAACG